MVAKSLSKNCVLKGNIVTQLLNQSVGALHIRLKKLNHFPKAIWAETKARFTGKPKPNQKAIAELPGGVQWALSSIALGGSIGINSYLASSLASYDLIGTLISMPAIVGLSIVTTGRFRVQQVTIGHHANHGTLFKGKRTLNRIAASISAALSMSQNPEDYKKDHNGFHHRMSTFISAEDPDAAFLMELGFYQGMKKRDAKKLLLKTLFSPRFHLTFFQARVRSSFVTSSWPHRTAVTLWMMVLGALAMAMPWWAFIISVLIPLGPLYHQSALLQFCSEHRWLSVIGGVGKDPVKYASACAGHFCGGRLPNSNLNGSTRVWAWWKWMFALAVFHAPVRFGVLVGDLPAHDWHHVAGLIDHDPHDWTNAIFERQRAIDNGNELVAGITEHWSLIEALDWVFDGLENPTA